MKNICIGKQRKANRKLESRRQLRQDGLGGNPPANNGNGGGTTFNTAGQGQIAGSIQTSFEYDGNSNQIAMVDDRGGVTRWAFDSHDPDRSGFRGSADAAHENHRCAVPLNRQVRSRYHDGSTEKFVFDLASDVVQFIVERNGDVASFWKCRAKYPHVVIFIKSVWTQKGLQTDKRW